MSTFVQSQSFLQEIGLSTPLDVIGPAIIGTLLAAFFFAFQNPAIVQNTGNPGGMFQCWDFTSCYWCDKTDDVQKPPFTPHNDASQKIVGDPNFAALLSKCPLSSGLPPTGCHTQYGTMPCA